MPKNRIDHVLFELAAAADRLSENDRNLTLHEVDEALKDAGYSAAELRERLHNATKALSKALRQAGVSVPNYLRDTTNRTAPLEVLAVRQPEAALDQMRKTFKELTSAAKSAVALPPGSLVAARAYRKSGDLSSEDERLLDEIEREVKGRATEDKDDDERDQEK